MFGSRKSAEKFRIGASKNKTQIYIYYDVGFPNALYIRGKGGGLEWSKGQKLKNAGPDLWIWETEDAFNECEFKVLINDERYEEGENHKISHGKKVQYTPHF